MGFKHWQQGLEVIALFFFAIAVPCFFIALWGSKMINALGNHPSRSAEIQAEASWKIFFWEIFSFLLLVGVFAFLYNIQNS